MRRAFLIHHIQGFKDWETCFHYVMEKADTFRIIFQGRSDVFDEEGLNAGKQVFLHMPSITISPYAGMENSIEVTGELNTPAREVFLTFMAPAFEERKPALWSFQFLQGHDVLLRVEDFTVGLLFLEESEVEYLLALGVSVDGTHLEEIDKFLVGEGQSDVEVISWSKDDLSSLADLLQTTFLKDGDH